MHHIMIFFFFFCRDVYALLYFQPLGSKQDTCVNFPPILIFLNMPLMVDLNSRMRKESSSHTLEALFKKRNILSTCGFFWFASPVFFDPSIISKMLFIHFLFLMAHNFHSVWSRLSHHLLKIYCSLGSVTCWHGFPLLQSLHNSSCGKRWRERNLFKPKLIQWFPQLKTPK